MHEIAVQIGWLGWYLFWISVWLFGIACDTSGIKEAIKSLKK